MCFGRSSKRDPAASDVEVLNCRPRASPRISAPEISTMALEVYTPPSGPPPNYRGPQQAVANPPLNQNEVYTSPSGLPPSSQEQYAPPLGPPPPQVPQHDWQTAVPDTSLLPPPPSVGYERSPTNNATEGQAISAENWLRSRPLQNPVQVADARAFDPLRTTLYAPVNFQGELKLVKMGTWQVRTKRKSPDSCLVSALPLYSVKTHSPLLANTSKTIYFEVKILPSSRSNEISLGLGFLAQPYPPFRLPGWERASLGVHGDDGHRYVNDKWGGRDFTQAFKRGQTVGIGMKFSSRILDQPPTYGDAQPAMSPIDVEVFFTRDGKIDGGWNIHEELDAVQDLPVTGLEGMHDLYAAVGTFDAVELEVRFEPKDWLYRP